MRYLLFDGVTGQIMRLADGPASSAHANAGYLGLEIHWDHANPETHRIDPATNAAVELPEVGASVDPDPPNGAAPMDVVVTLTEPATIASEGISVQEIAGTHVLTFSEAGTYEIKVSATLRRSRSWTVEVS